MPGSIKGRIVGMVRAEKHVPTARPESGSFLFAYHFSTAPASRTIPLKKMPFSIPL